MLDMKLTLKCFKCYLSCLLSFMVQRLVPQSCDGTVSDGQTTSSGPHEEISRTGGEKWGVDDT
jgi:hypothetical protein